ncbi:MAG: hypothetical protein ACJATT_005553 [Myxococcota bacterium]|jgi:hypothetical protein
MHAKVEAWLVAQQDNHGVGYAANAELQLGAST